MAEAFGIFAGAAGLAGLFTPCVECFEYVQFGRNFGQDCERSLGSEAGRRWTCYVSCITTMATDNGRAPGHTVDHLKTIQVPSFPLREKPEHCWAHERMPTGRIENTCLLEESKGFPRVSTSHGHITSAESVIMPRHF